MAGLCVGSDLSSQSPSAQDNSSEKSHETTIQSTEEEGGWPYEFVGVVDKELECTVCLMPLRNPWLTECGHNMCRTCLDKMLLQKNAFCPEDRNPISKENIFRDMRVHRKVMGLKVKCPYAEMEPHACKWTGELNDLTKKHLDFCESEKVSCTREDCKDKLSRNTFRLHVSDRCLWRERNCYYCLTPVVVCMLQNHEDMDCMEITVTCTNTCGEQMPRKELTFHLENNCLNRTISCPFKDGGCKEEFAARDIGKHLNDNIGKHLIVMYNKAKDLGQNIEVLMEELKASNREIEMLKKSNIDQDRQIKEIQRQQEFQRQQEIGKDKEMLQLRLAQFAEVEHVSHFLTFASKNDNKNILGNVIKFLKAESIYDCNFMNNAWSYRKDDKMVFIWFVNDFESRQQEQKFTPDKDVISPNVCTGQNGYFMKFSFDPNGWAESKGSFLSCSVGKGEDGPNDNKIKYPHDQLFRVTVINFKDREDDVTVEDTFILLNLNELQSDSMFRTIHNMLDLSRVNDFRLDDTIVLKISVNHYTI